MIVWLSAWLLAEVGYRSPNLAALAVKRVAAEAVKAAGMCLGKDLSRSRGFEGVGREVFSSGCRVGSSSFLQRSHVCKS